MPWVAQLIRLVPELNGGMLPDHSMVWEEMNLAWAVHEIIGDFATAVPACLHVPLPLSWSLLPLTSLCVRPGCLCPLQLHG